MAFGVEMNHLNSMRKAAVLFCAAVNTARELGI